MPCIIACNLGIYLFALMFKFFSLFLLLSFSSLSLSSYFSLLRSLGVVRDLSEHVVESTPCNSLSTILNGTQLNFCNYNQKVINSIAIGARRGIIACQNGFENWRWNCTTFTGDYLFGSFVSNGEFPSTL